MGVYVDDVAACGSGLAREAYDRLAPVYDLFTEGYDHATWLGELESLALEHGLGGRRLLDLACGTGKSFLPMLERGYRVSACDVSPAMVALAAEKVSGRDVDLFVADLCDLPDAGPADLVTCLDDAMNYLVGDGDLALALRGIERCLRPGGLALFDVNTLATYRSSFASDAVVEGPGSFLCWHGLVNAGDFGEGDVAEAAIEVFGEQPGGCWTRTTSRHVQRHRPLAEVAEAVAGASLELLAVRGQARGGRLVPYGGELAHPKLVYLAGKPTFGGAT
ncbi:MAG TPA: class I SAM-dependent methyltransferase [Thermoleophilaceae bacterium]|nr:class I SAM-dependent methyltransferase [Thermoleophilaceae bacterium]